jgi:hypothetical protein
MSDGSTLPGGLPSWLEVIVCRRTVLSNRWKLLSPVTTQATIHSGPSNGLVA